MSTWGSRGITVATGSAAGVSITDNTIFNTRNGIVVQYGDTVTISDNTIYNTKGGVLQYTNNDTDASNRTMTDNHWGTVHNEWDIVWNSGGAYAPTTSEQVSVLGVAQANNDAYVLDLRELDSADHDRQPQPYFCQCFCFNSYGDSEHKSW